MFRSHSDCVRTFQDDSQSSIKHNSEGYVCDLCPAGSVKYITETDVEIHRKKNHFREIMMVQHRERFCTVCMKLQPNYTSLIAHLKTEHLYSSPTAKRIEREIYICDYCNHVFFNKAILEIHIQLRHLYDSVQKRREIHFQCPKCQKKSSLLNVWFHFQQHGVPSVTVCDICVSTFPGREQLHDHVRTHPLLYRCDTCQYSTNKETLYNLHLENHESRVINRKRNIDKTVKRVFQTTKKEDVLLNFNIHNLLKGLKLPNMLGICILCREICTDKIDMQFHVLRDHLFKDTTEKVKYVCVCGEEFSNKILIKQHVFTLDGHRIFVPDKIPKVLQISLKNEQIQENTTDDQAIPNTSDSASDSYKEPISSDNLIIPEDVTITNLKDEHTDEPTENNLIINTDNLTETAVIVITTAVNNETDLDQINTDSQIITTDTKEMIIDSITKHTDDENMIIDSEIALENQEMIADSQTMTTDSQ